MGWGKSGPRGGGGDARVNVLGGPHAGKDVEGVGDPTRGNS